MHEPAKRVEVDAVLDIDGYGEVIGIEIIDLGTLVDGTVLSALCEMPEGDGPHVSLSYDEEVDAFYLRMRRERSLDQLPLIGEFLIDEKGALLGLEVDISDLVSNVPK